MQDIYHTRFSQAKIKSVSLLPIPKDGILDLTCPVGKELVHISIAEVLQNGAYS